MSDPLARFKAAMAGRYAVEQEIGSGGMAVVYSAHDAKHDRLVALKLLRPEVAAAIGPERFLQEIKLAARLTHPHIMPLHDSGEADGFLYFVMPYVEGESLRDRLVSQPQLPVEEALGIAREVAGALDYAHRHDVVHRDIKPENIMLHDGAALVTDFGIGKALSAAGEERLTQTGLALGTPAYMSPEQVTADAELDGRSDVYSLGCVIYEMLAGEPPFAGTTAQAIMAKRITDSVPRLRAIRNTVPREIDDAVCRAMGKSPEDRFATTGDLANALVQKAETAVTASAGPGAHRPAPADKSIAVLPFANMSADPENEYFSDGITEEIINALTQLRDLDVAARSSSFAFKGEKIDMAAVGAKLKVATVLEGSVRKAGNRLRITAQLIKVADGYHLWSERYDREMDDVFAIQDEIATSIANKLKVTLDGESGMLVKPGTANLDAYNLYLKGRYFWNKRGGGLSKAIGYFQQAIELDPEYVLPVAGLADTYCLLGAYGYMPSVEGAAKAKAHADRALALDENVAEANYSMGLYEMYFGWDLNRAERHFRRAIELDPKMGIGCAFLAQFYWHTSRVDEALQMARRARELEPLSPVSNAIVAWVLAFCGAVDEGLEAVDQAEEIEPKLALAFWARGLIRGVTDENDKAIEEMEAAVQYSQRSALMLALLGMVYARGERADDARQVLAELERRWESERFPVLFAAQVRWTLGESDRAFELFSQAFESRDVLAWAFGTLPILEDLGADPRWKALLDSVGLGWVARAQEVGTG